MSKKREKWVTRSNIINLKVTRDKEKKLGVETLSEKQKKKKNMVGAGG